MALDRPSTARLAARLSALPLDLLTALTAEILEASPAAMSKAEATLLRHCPPSPSAVEGIFLSADLMLSIMTQAPLDGHPAACVCKLWRSCWNAVMPKRRHLRYSHVAPIAAQPPPVRALSVVRMPCGERLCTCMAVHSNGRTPFRLAVYDKSLRSVCEVQVRDRVIVEGPHGPYLISSLGIRRVSIDDNGQLTTLAERRDLTGCTCCVAAPARALLYTACYDEFHIDVLDALTLERIGVIPLPNVHHAHSMVAGDDALYVHDRRPGESDTIHLISYAGEYQRALSGGWGRIASICRVRDRLYVAAPARAGSAWRPAIFVVSLEGTTLRIFHPNCWDNLTFCTSRLTFLRDGVAHARQLHVRLRRRAPRARPQRLTSPRLAHNPRRRDQWPCRIDRIMRRGLAGGSCVVTRAVCGVPLRSVRARYRACYVAR